MARPKAPHPVKSVTINLRLTIREKQTLEEIAEREERTASFLIGWFTRWSIAHYKEAGSLMRMKQGHFTISPELDEQQEGDFRLGVMDQEKRTSKKITKEKEID